MKKLLVLFTFIGLGVLNSCGDDTASNDGEALTITSDAATHFEGEAFKFTVNSIDGSDVSADAKILVNDAPIVGNIFYSLIPGTFTVKATYSGTTTKATQVTVTTNPVALTSITVTPSAPTVVTGDVITFSAMGNNNSNLTQACTYFVNGTAITGNTYTATSEGDVDVYAVYPSATAVTSATTKFAVSKAINFTKRVLIEDYTGAWCGWCPRVAYAIELVKEQKINAVPVAIHVSAGSTAQDPFNFSGAQTLSQAFGVSGFPTAKLNRKTTWTANEPDHIKQVSDLTTGINPRLGLAMNTSVEGSTATVKVNVKFGQNFSGLKLVVYALEDKLVADQHNYTTLKPYADSNNKAIPVLKDFIYDDVLRAGLTNLLGDEITGATSINDEFTKTFTYAIPSTVKAENLHFVAFVVDSSKKALNVRNASNNENQTYEIAE